jgi:hypothetical protein
MSSSAALRRLFGDEVFLFTSRDEGRYELHADTRLGPLFDGSGVFGAGGMLCMLRCRT